MKIKVKLLLLTMILVLLPAVGLQAAVYRVAKNTAAYSAQFDNIQDAVNACKSNGDATNTIIVADDGEYDERVEIDSLHNLVLVSQEYLDNPKQTFYSSLPTIKFHDMDHTHPHNFAETKTLSDDFQQNGALAIMNSSNITIEGIKIVAGDDEHGESYNYPGVWPDQPTDNGGKWPLVGGNNGVAIFLSKKVTIRNCDISNAYFGFYVVDRNTAGLFSEANPADNDVADQVALSNYGQMGNHLFELNRIHDNTFAVGTEIMWGLGSVFRHNLVYNNFGKKKVDNMYGGVFRVKDQVVQPWLIYNNTFFKNEVIMQHVYWRAGANFVFANNIFGEGSLLYGSGVADVASQDVMPYINSLYYNIFQFQFKEPSGQVDGFGVTGPPYYIKMDDPKVDPQIFLLQGYGGLMQGMQASSFEPCGTVPVTYDGTAYNYTSKSPQFDTKLVSVPTAGSVKGKENVLVVTKFDGGIYRNLFKSIDPSSPDFLIPNYDDSYVLKQVRDRSEEDMGVRDADATNGDVGALCILQNGGGIDWTGQYKGAKLQVVDGTFVSVDAKDVVINFPINMLDGKAGDIDTTTLEYEKIDWYDDLPFLEPLDNAQMSTEILKNPVNVISSVTSGKPIIGANQLKMTLPNAAATNSYGMFHIVVKAKNKLGQTIYSNIGVFPYRNFTYIYSLNGTVVKGFTESDLMPLDVHLEDKDGNEINKAEVGEDIYLHVKAKSSFAMDPGNFNINAFSGEFLYDENEKIINKWPTPFVDEGTIKVKFMRTGYQILNASGYNSSKQTAIGSSLPIEITPAEPNYAKFYDPPSSKGNNILTSIPAHSTQKCKVQVFDRFGNVSTGTGGAYKVKVTIDNEENFKLVDPVGEFVVDDQGFVSFSVEAVADYESGITKKAKVTAKLMGATGEEDYSNLIVGPPLEMLYGHSTVDTAFIGDIVPMKLLVSKNGKDAIPNISSGFTIAKGSGLLFYWDAAGTLPISEEVLTSFTEDTTIYISSSIETVANFSVKEKTGRRTSIDKVVFITPPIVSIFITWSKDSTDEANSPIAIPISDGSFELYSWGKDKQGHIIATSIDWEGTGVFAGLSAHGKSVKITLDPTMIGQGTFKGEYKAKDLKTETADITILDKVDEIYLLKAQDYDSSITRTELKALQLTKDSLITINLGDSLSLYSIGVDTTKNVIFKLRLQWNISNPNGFKFRKDSSNANNFTRVFDINDIDAAGDALIKIQYTPSDTVSKPILRKGCSLKIIDPVDNIVVNVPDNVSKEEMFILNNSDNNNDTVSVDANAIYYNLNRLGVSTFWKKNDSTNLQLAVKWNITSVKIAGKVYKYPKDTSVVRLDLVVPEIDMIELTAERNGIKFTFYVSIQDLIRVGIFPNPTPMIRFNLSKDKRPTIRVVENGTIENIFLMIFDAYGNSVKTLQGIGNGGDFSKDVTGNTSSAPSDTTTGKVDTYISKEWDGKNEFGNSVASGKYILNFKIKVKDKNNKEFNAEEIIPFYIIGNKE